MRKRNDDYFSFWLGVTVIVIVILLFLALTRYRPDFFRDISLIP